MADRCRCHDGPAPARRSRCRLCGRVAGPEPHHVCHAEGCDVPVPPRMLMCKKHWFMVPQPLRDRVWATYVSGQEIRKDPTDDYLDAMRDAVESVARQEGRRGA